MSTSNPETVLGVEPPISGLIGPDTRDSLYRIANRLSLLMALDPIGELVGDAETALHSSLEEIKAALVYESCRLEAEERKQEARS